MMNLYSLIGELQSIRAKIERERSELCRNTMFPPEMREAPYNQHLDAANAIRRAERKLIAMLPVESKPAAQESAHPSAETGPTAAANARKES